MCLLRRERLSIQSKRVLLMMNRLNFFKKQIKSKDYLLKEAKLQQTLKNQFKLIYLSQAKGLRCPSGKCNLFSLDKQLVLLNQQMTIMELLHLEILTSTNSSKSRILQLRNALTVRENSMKTLQLGISLYVRKKQKKMQ